MIFRDALKKMGKEKKEEIFREKKKRRLDKVDKFQRKVYNVIRNGVTVPGVSIPPVGATDTELMFMFPDVRESTVRYARWKLQKLGYVKESGKRSLLKGKPVQRIWMVTDKVMANEV